MRTPLITRGMEPEARSAGRRLARVSGTCTERCASSRVKGVVSPAEWKTTRSRWSPRVRRLTTLPQTRQPPASNRRADEMERAGVCTEELAEHHPVQPGQHQ